jgi:hypothetical protein
VGNIGSRSGEQVDLRYYFGVSGVVDGTNAPFAVDSKGNLVHTPYLYGIEVDGGVYGVHSWKRSQLGLNYSGSYTRYFNSYQDYSSTNHALSLGYTNQLSKRLRLDFREAAGSLTYGTGQVADAATTDLTASFTPVQRLFDTRTYYLQSSVSATYLQSARTSFTVGGSAFLQNLKSTGLSNGWGYSFNANMMRRMSKTATVGATYEYSHFEFPGFSSKSTSHTFHGLYATGFGQFWTLSIEAGATVTQVDSVFDVLFLDNNLVPVLVPLPVSLQTIYPSGTVTLKRQFRRASLGFNYFRGVNSGNGAYNTGRLDNAYVSYSYTGLRKLNVGADGGYYSLTSIGQSLGNYAQYSAGAGLNYALGHAIHLSLRYDFRAQQVDLSNYRHNGSRATVGLNFSPGNLPLSLW